MRLLFFTTVCLNLLLVSCQPSVQWVASSAEASWVPMAGVESVASNSVCDLIVDRKDTLHPIIGFGACFNELGWTSLSLLSQQDRDVVLSELFEPGKGANFTICRMPVGANDFSRDWYSYNETDGDFEMAGFSIGNDQQTLVPFIHAAQKYQPGLKLWASPWSPPSWMKWNKHYACSIPWPGLAEQFQNHLPADRQGKEGTNMFIQEDSYFAAYALYFAKFIEAYRNEGVEVSMVMPQNEFNSCQIFPSCTWTAGGLATFVGKYLGPAMEKLGVDVMFGTMERPNEALVDTILQDPMASKYVKGLGFQWAGKEAIVGLHKRYPSMEIYQTEQECGDGKNDWKHCNHAWELMKHYLLNGANAYMYWNISLEEGGYSRWGWQQNSLVTVFPQTCTFRFNHEYYLLKHVSHFVKPGARIIKTQGVFDDALAFVNSDGSTVVVMRNNNEDQKTVIMQVEGKCYRAELAPGSFNTFLFN